MEIFKSPHKLNVIIATDFGNLEKKVNEWYAANTYIEVVSIDVTQTQQSIVYLITYKEVSPI